MVSRSACSPESRRLLTPEQQTPGRHASHEREFGSTFRTGQNLLPRESSQLRDRIVEEWVNFSHVRLASPPVQPTGLVGTPTVHERSAPRVPPPQAHRNPRRVRRGFHSFRPNYAPPPADRARASTAAISQAKNGDDSKATISRNHRISGSSRICFTAPSPLANFFTCPHSRSGARPSWVSSS